MGLDGHDRPGADARCAPGVSPRGRGRAHRAVEDTASLRNRPRSLHRLAPVPTGSAPRDFRPDSDQARRRHRRRSHGATLPHPDAGPAGHRKTPGTISAIRLRHHGRWRRGQRGRHQASPTDQRLLATGTDPRDPQRPRHRRPGRRAEKAGALGPSPMDGLLHGQHDRSKRTRHAAARLRVLSFPGGITRRQARPDRRWTSSAISRIAGPRPGHRAIDRLRRPHGQPLSTHGRRRRLRAVLTQRGIAQCPARSHVPQQRRHRHGRRRHRRGRRSWTERISDPAR